MSSHGSPHQRVGDNLVQIGRSLPFAALLAIGFAPYGTSGGNYRAVGLTVLFLSLCFIGSGLMWRLMFVNSKKEVR